MSILLIVCLLHGDTESRTVGILPVLLPAECPEPRIGLGTQRGIAYQREVLLNWSSGGISEPPEVARTSLCVHGFFWRKALWHSAEPQRGARPPDDGEDLLLSVPFVNPVPAVWLAAARPGGADAEGPLHRRSSSRGSWGLRGSVSSLQSSQEPICQIPAGKYRLTVLAAREEPSILCPQLHTSLQSRV